MVGKIYAVILMTEGLIDDEQGGFRGRGREWMLTGISYADFLECGESEEDGSVIRHFIEVCKRRGLGMKVK